MQRDHPNCLLQETSIFWKIFSRATLQQMVQLSMLSKVVGRYCAVKPWAGLPWLATWLKDTPRLYLPCHLQDVPPVHAEQCL